MEIETGRMRITERDKECVRFVVEQGFATIEQLWKVAWSDQKNSSYTYNRVLSLEKFGFLKSVKINDATKKVVTSTPKGLKDGRSAECLAVDPTFRKLGSRHVPDAFYISSRGIRTAIEYDRTIRKKDRIKERLSLYLAELMSPDRNIDRLIYLVAPAYLKTYQQIFDQNFESVRGMFVFTTLDEFKKQITGVSQ